MSPSYDLAIIPVDTGLVLKAAFRPAVFLVHILVPAVIWWVTKS
jgi:hypothetical protein